MSIKLRVAGVFTLALAVAFALGGWLFVSQLRNELLKALDKTVIAQLAPFRSARSLRGARTIGAPENSVIQILGSNRNVLRHSSEAGTTPLLSPGETRLAMSAGLTKKVGDEEVRFHAAHVAHTGATAVVGVSTEDQVTAPIGAQTMVVAIGGAIFVLIGALGAYWLAAAALSPVERMRREVAALSASESQAGVQLPRTRDELAALAGTMNDLLARMHEALARQRAFVADASHELRTPLAVLGAELELAGRPGRSREQLVQATTSAEEEVARLTRLSNDLLILARSDEAMLPVRPAPTRVRDLLERSADRAAGPAGSAAVVVDADPGLVARLDQDRIREAVDNLVENALRFAPAGSQVRIKAWAQDTDLIIEVADAGPGFPAEFLPHAFERFRRPDEGRARPSGGAGLGLAIVAAIAAAHGGSVSARNASPSGAIVRLDLPGTVPA